MGGGDKSEGEHEDTSTIRELPKGYSTRSKSRSAKKDRDYLKIAKTHHLRVKPKREETGKEILDRILRQINASIRRKERAKKK